MEMVRRNNKKILQTSVRALENNFHHAKEYHSFETKKMFLTENESNDTIKSNLNEAYTIKKKMTDNNWCVTEHESMPKRVLSYSYLVTNHLQENEFKSNLLSNYKINKHRIGTSKTFIKLLASNERDVVHIVLYACKKDGSI